MGLFARAATEIRGYRLEQFSPQSTAYWVAKLFGGGSSTQSGVNVTMDRAMAVAWFYASVRNLAEDVAGLPIVVSRRQGDKIAPDPTGRAWDLLNVRANPEMSAMSFRETIQGHLVSRGDGFAEKELDQALRVKWLWPLNPARMRMVRNGRNGVTINGAPDGQLAFLYELPEGGQKIFTPELIYHPRGFGPDGLRGYSLLAMAREALGVALATEGYAARFFANDARPGSVLKHPKTLSPKARENIELSWKDAHEGLDNAHRIAILEEGLDVSKVGIDPVDAQFLETRKWTRGEIGAFSRMPPDKLGDLERAMVTNTEQTDINYVKYTLRSWCIRQEQQLAIDGILDPDQTAVHDVAAFLKADAKTRGEYLHSLRQDGAISGEDIRAYEGFAPSGQPAASELLVPLNMMPASAFGPDGLTMAQRAHAAWELLRAGYEASSVNVLLGLGDLAHTGLVPGTTTPAPDEQTDGTRSNGAPATNGHSHEHRDELADAFRTIAAREPVAPDVRVDVHPSEVHAPVTIEPGAVVVHNDAPPPRKRRRTVERDTAGRISAVIETEE